MMLYCYGSTTLTDESILGGKTYQQYYCAASGLLKEGLEAALRLFLAYNRIYPRSSTFFPSNDVVRFGSVRWSALCWENAVGHTSPFDFLTHRLGLICPHYSHLGSILIRRQ